MPGFDGTGPQGQGPLTGRGGGYCVLRVSGAKTPRLEGLVGLAGAPVSSSNANAIEREREVISMPFGNGTGPNGAGPMTGRAAGFCAGYPMPGYRNAGALGVRRAVPHGARAYGSGVGYASNATGWFGRWIRGGFGLGRSFGPGRGRGRGRGGGRRRSGYY
jgi:hypothetical protein